MTNTLAHSSFRHSSFVIRHSTFRFMSDDVLSQAEIESLLSSLSTSARKETIALHDFKRPNRVDHKQLDLLRVVHEGFGRNLGVALSSLLRSIVQVKLVRVDPLPYSQFIASLENPTCFNLLRAAPLEGHLILDLSPAILYPIIDRLLGGGRESAPITARPLTDIELRLAGKIAAVSLEELRRAWQSILPLELSVVRVESNPQLVQILPPNEAVVRIGFELTLGESRGMVTLCIPFHSLERVADKLLTSDGTSNIRAAANAETQRQTAEDLRGSTVEVAVELARAKITTSELVGLRAGDVITTDQDISHPLQVNVAGSPKFLARPGVYKGHKAIRVEEVLGRDGGPIS
jgi:flagellar motor switch protein FliM